MNRLDQTFARLRAARRLGLFPYLTVGFPTRDATERLALAMCEAGADGLELGVPFSDPVADGVTILRAGETALRQGVTLPWALEVAQRLRARTDRVLLAMTYFNPLHQYGVERFARDGAQAGLDGVIVPDLPFGEAAELLKAAAAHRLYVIQLIAPTSTDHRLEEVARTAQGFVYCVSLLGTTGARATLSDRLPGFLARVRARVSQPLVVGFGISRPEHLAALHSLADGAIVGAAIADLLEATPADERETALRTYIGALSAACQA